MSSSSGSTAPSSSSSSLRPSASNTANSTPWQSPSSLSRSSPRKWTTETNSNKNMKREESTLSINNGSDRRGNATNKRQRGGLSSSASGSDNLGGFSMPFRTTSNTSEQGSASSRDQWWEHVLPPGQLAERLRKAQGSSTREIINVEEGPRSSRKAILRNATPSERKTWTSLADFGREDGKPEQSRSGVNSTRSSVGSLSSMKSDVSSQSGASTGTEDSPLDGRSPTREDWEQQKSTVWENRNATLSPPLTHSISRSTTCRRSRVMGDNNNNNHDVAIGLGIGAKCGQDSELDERFRQWNSNMPFQQQPSSHSLLRPFPSTTGGRSSPAYTSTTGGRSSPAYTLADTPEVSSEEEHGDDDDRSVASSSTTTTTTKTTTTRRITRTSNSLRSFETVQTPSNSTSNKRPSMTNPSSSSSSSRRKSLNNSLYARHVSFNQDVEFSGDEKWSSHTIGRHSGRIQSMLNDTNSKRRSWQPDSYHKQSNQPFPTSSSDARISSTVPQFSQIRGRRMPCYSAPTSPRFTLQSLEDDNINKNVRPRGEMDLTSSTSSEGLPKLPDLALLSSLGVAQTQLASAGNIALTLTRQLSVPLRPMLHLTVFLSISSFTFMALAGFLVAGYLITAWDDVNHRGKRIQRNVSSAKSWCEKLLGVEDGQTGSKTTTTNSLDQNEPLGRSDSTSSVPGRHRRTSSARIVTAPIRFAFAVPATIAYKLTPTAISESFGFGNETTAFENKESAAQDYTSDTGSKPSSFAQRSTANGHGDGRNKSPSPSQSIPPRPPLSSLLPSIFLTILIALGAGLVSFFVDKATAPSSTTTSSTSAHAFAPSRSATTALPHPSSRIPLQKRSSMHSHHGRRQSYASSSSFSQDRRPYEVVDF